LSIQVLNELYSVLTRKKFKTKEEAQIIIKDLIDSYKIYCVDEQCIKRAIAINIQYHFSYWDSLIIAAALEFGCTTLYSEDLQHNQLIEDTLTILNPFLMS
jgi:predicted nucleic acid-binding protein